MAEIVLPVRDPSAIAARFRDVLGIARRPAADGGPYSLDIGSTTLTLEALGTSDGRPASLGLTAGAARRLDVGRAHGVVLDLR